VLESLDATAVDRWCAAGLAGLRRHQREIDELNVFPVPDGDTGTNLVLTLTAAHEALAELAGAARAADPSPAASPATEDQPGEPTRLGQVLRCMARGALLGARGNSGVIVSQLLGGLADALAGTSRAGGLELASALGQAASAGYAAVAAPVEGTVLSVARSAAEAARETGSDELVTVVKAAAEGAARALARTPDQLPALARAGVVDAGGRGLCVLLDALVEVVTGAAPAAMPVHPPALLPVHREAGSADYAYEVQYLLDAAGPAVAELKGKLTGLGDSLVVVGAGDGTWNVHVHVNDVGPAIEAGVEAGRPHRITVTRFADSAPPARPATVDPAARGAVVVVTGKGLADVFRDEGAVTVAGPGPSTAELLAAIRATGAGLVVLLPNEASSHGVAAAAADRARAEGVRVGVVPTRSPVQALAALAVRDHRRRFEDDLIAMAEAAGACRYAEVTTASREAVTVAGVCRPGDVLALVEGEVNLIGQDLVATCVDLVDRLLAGGGELVTLVTGGDAPDDLAGTVRAHLAQRWPFVEVQVFPGGQPVYPLVVGVE
jgi:DAK2 domain fusion protein YloV